MSELIDGLPKHDELFWPVVRALRQLDGSADNEQLVEKVSELLEIDDDLTAIPHKAGPQTEIAYRIAWVKSWLKWGGMVDNPRRAVWVLTERGRGATEEEVNAVRQRRRAEAARKRKAKLSRIENGDAEDLEDAPSSEELDEFADDAWQNELLDIIRTMEAPAFERLARQLLLSLGFSDVEVVGKSGDGGIDLLGVVKINDVLTFRVLAQCKRYKGTVAPKDRGEQFGQPVGGAQRKRRVGHKGDHPRRAARQQGDHLAQVGRYCTLRSGNSLWVGALYRMAPAP